MNPGPLHHAILGAGGVGGLMGACLARSGASVTLVVRPESLAQYPEQLQLESAFGNFSVPVSRSAEVPPADVLWITVKATQLEPALHALTRSESVRAIVPLLNGIDHIPLLRSRYGADKVIAATIGVESERVAPGHIIHRSPFARLGVSSKGQALLGPTVAQFQQIGFDCRFVDDEPTLMWSKLVFLAPLALTSTAGDLTTGQITSDPACRRQLEACVRETGAVAAAEGANVDVEAVLAFMMKMPGNMRSSMQKDVAQGKPPELDAIAGPILRGARRHAIDVPVTRTLVAAVEQKSGISASLSC
jgi:2-dehydropantoate 2-reductase